MELTCGISTQKITILKNSTTDLSVRSVLLNAGDECGDVSTKDEKCDALSNFLTDNNNNNNNNNNKLTDDKIPYYEYKYTPTNVLENENFTLYWNRSILTDKTIPFNRPDITFMNKKTKSTFLIDITVPNTHNLAKTIADKQNKYQNWRMKYVLCGSKRQHK